MSDPAAATILLVDDDEATLYILRRWLTHLGVRVPVLQATDGQQALALVQAHCQAGAAPGSLLVLLDLSMPVMDGLTFLEHQQRQPLACRQATTVVVVATVTSPAEWDHARSLAADTRLKPIDIEQLAALVRKYLPAALPD